MEVSRSLKMRLSFKIPILGSVDFLGSTTGFWSISGVFVGDGDGETGAGVSGVGEGVDVGDEIGIGSCLIGSGEGEELTVVGGVEATDVGSGEFEHFKIPNLHTPFPLKEYRKCYSYQTREEKINESKSKIAISKPR